MVLFELALKIKDKFTMVNKITSDSIMYS